MSTYDDWKLSYPPEWDEPSEEELEELKEHMCYGCVRFKPGREYCPNYSKCAEVL